MEEVKKDQEVKNVELCAIPREFVLKNLSDLYEANKSVFDQYNLWIHVLNSQVQVNSQDETKVENND